MSKYIILLFLVLLGAFSYAQQMQPIDKVSDKQIEAFIKEAESRGLTEMQVEALARANGYTDEDIIKMRERINRLKTGTENTKTGTENKTVREQVGEIAERADVQVVEETNSKEILKKELFGSTLFSNKKLDFQPNLRIPTPPNYIIGPDDQLSVDITGYAYQHYDLVVSAEGTVKIESLAPIYVNGLTIEKAKIKIEQRLVMLFAGLRNGALSLDITLAKVRTIKVTVIGEVQSPGSYNLSSLATLFNALYVSGGPTELGSFRNIQLLRNNKIIQHLDLYDFLLTGSLTNNINLMDQDVIFIPLAERKITFNGEVKRPSIFEIKPNETLQDAIQFAGGFTDNAYRDLIQITRNTTTEREVINLQTKEFVTAALKDGDQVEVQAILNRFANRVEIQGAVFRPGYYALSSELKTVGQLITQAEGLREDAFRNRAILKREQENLDPEFIQLNLNDILAGKDVELKREDVLIIKSIVELRELRKVTILGAINLPGEYDFVDNMTLKDLILLSGGLKEGATNKRIEIARRLYNDESSDETVEIIPMELDKSFDNKLNTRVLFPFDQVYIRELPNYQKQEVVTISGEINYPGDYVIKNRTERITDLLERAGNTRPEAYLKGAKFYREGKQVAINIEELLQDKTATTNLYLAAGDRLVIPKEEQTVKISGQVLSPTSVAFRPELGFTDYIAQAGGFTDSSSVRKTYVRYANGYTDRTRAFLGVKIYPRIEKGMEIIVPVRRKYTWTPAAISSAFVSIATMLATVVRLLN